MRKGVYDPSQTSILAHKTLTKVLENAGFHEAKPVTSLWMHYTCTLYYLGLLTTFKSSRLVNRSFSSDQLCRCKL